MNTPDKLLDNRPESLMLTPTIGETLEQARLIQNITPGDERTERLQKLNNFSAQLMRDYVVVTSDTCFMAFPQTLIPSDGEQRQGGSFIGYYDINYKKADTPDDFVPDPIVTLGVEMGTGTFTNEYTEGSFKIRSFAPVDRISALASTTEMGRLLINTPAVDSEKVLSKIKKIIETTRKRLGSEPFVGNYEKLSHIEPWDFRESTVSLHDIRRLQLNVTVDRARILFTDKQSMKPVWIEERDLAFRGYFWATSALSVRERFLRPKFVFELYGSENPEIKKLSDADPTDMPPLVYVPINERVALDIEIS
jgi:hypothetical protein